MRGNGAQRTWVVHSILELQQIPKSKNIITEKENKHVIKTKTRKILHQEKLKNSKTNNK